MVGCSHKQGLSNKIATNADNDSVWHDILMGDKQVWKW